MTAAATAAAWSIAWASLYLYGFWLLYVLIMGFYRAWLNGRLTRTALVLACPALAVGYLTDLVANWTLATLWFWEWPRHPLELVTDRLSRYIATAMGRRRAHATWICATLLDYFDPHDRHCAP